MTRLPFFIALTLGLAILGFGVHPAQADPRGWFGRFVNGLFGEYRTEPSPEYTGLAPFSSNNQTQVQEKLDHPEARVPVTQAHLDDEALVSWGLDQVLTSLTHAPFDTSEKGKGALEARSTALQKTFAPSGVNDLVVALQQVAADTGLVGARKQLIAFSNLIPGPESVRNKGVFGGAFRWLVDIPVTVSAVPTGVHNYRSLGRGDATTRFYTLRLQIGRVPASTQYPYGMVIEHFTVLTPSG